MYQSSVSAESNFAHLAASLEKHGYSHAAYYVRGIAHGAKSKTMTAADVWRHTGDIKVLRSLLSYIGTVFPYMQKNNVAMQKAAAFIDMRNGQQTEGNVNTVHETCPQPFPSAHDRQIGVTLTEAEVRAIVSGRSSATRKIAIDKIKAALN